MNTELEFTPDHPQWDEDKKYFYIWEYGHYFADSDEDFVWDVINLFEIEKGSHGTTCRLKFKETNNLSIKLFLSKDQIKDKDYEDVRVEFLKMIYSMLDVVRYKRDDGNGN